MGIIINQSIKGSIWSYVGVVIGFITTAFIFPNYLSTDTIGLFGLLVAYSTLFSQLASLGINGATARLFPFFRNKENGHNGYLFIAGIAILAGFALFLVIYFFFSPMLIESNIEKSKLFSDYIYLIVPLTFFTTLFTFFDVYNKLLYDVISGTFLLEFLQRLLVLFVTILFVFGIFNLHQLIIAYVIAICVKTIIIFGLLIFKREVNLRPQLQFVNRKLRKEIVSVSGFSILAGFGSTIVFQIDKIIVNEMIDLSSTGIYTIAFFFGTLVVIPSRPLLKISGTIIAEAWKNNDIKQIDIIYKKTCLNQYIIGGILFISIWANINNIIQILGEEYSSGKWVIFFIGLGYLIDMVTGANGQIISFSKHYKAMLVFVVILIFLVVINNLLFIPIWGITGAAIASAFSMFLNNLMRYIYLYSKFNFQPFNMKFLMITIFLAISYFLGSLLPEMNLFLDILLRSGCITVVFGALILFFKVSEDVNLTIGKIMRFRR